MKKLLIFTNILTLVILYFSSFTKKAETTGSIEKPDCNNISANYSGNPVNGISYGTAGAMAGGYKNNQWKKLNQNQPYQEARSVWFSLDRLKAFIWEIENQTCIKQCSEKLDLGVRIYIAAYPDLQNMQSSGVKPNTDYKDVNTNYGKHLTMFLVPTYKVKNVINTDNVDFDPRNMGKDYCKPTPLKKLMNINWPDKAEIMTPKNQMKLSTIPYDSPSGKPTQDAQLKKSLAGQVPPQKPALILSAMEAQFMFPKRIENTMAKSTSIMNHGNTIPPDVDDGSAF